MNEIWHGDSRMLAAELPDQIDCCVTDPPYGMAFQSNMSTTPKGMAVAEEIANDGDLDTALTLFFDVMREVEPRMKEHSDLYVFTRWDMIHEWTVVIERLGLKVKQLLVWSKEDPGMGDLEGNWGCGHEMILYAKKGRRPVRYRRSGVLTYPKVPPAHMIHPTEKPVGLIERLIDMSTESGDLVVDPFSGSGATSVAAMNLARHSIAIELKESYVNLGRRRLEQQTFA